MTDAPRPPSPRPTASPGGQAPPTWDESKAEDRLAIVREYQRLFPSAPPFDVYDFVIPQGVRGLSLDDYRSAMIGALPMLVRALAESPAVPPSLAAPEPGDGDAPPDDLEMAWVIIANVGGGDWSRESPDWQDAAAKWRDRYMLALRPASPETERAP